jgi:chorismate mutase
MLSLRTLPRPVLLRPTAAGALAFLAAALGSPLDVVAQAEPMQPSPRSTLPDSRPMSLPRAPVFFPPQPPPLGRIIPRGPALGDSRLPSPPAEVSAYVNEPFYPALASRLHHETLKEPLRRQLEAYRATKLALLRELRSELTRLQEAEPSARREGLAALASRQGPRLAQLEADAEELRRTLQKGDYTWGAQREWRLGDRERRGFSPVEIAQVMRAYAFEQHGLLPAQRRLLREISLELLAAADDEKKATAAQPYVFFPPEPARVQFPDPLPPDAAAKLAAYQAKKTVLKKELYDAVHEHDNGRLGFLKANKIAALAKKQAGPLAELETLAEELRGLLPPPRELAPIVDRTPLPVALQERLAQLMTEAVAAQTEASRRIDGIVARARPLPFQSSYRFDVEGLKFVVLPSRSAARDPVVAKKVQAVRDEISAVAEDYGRALAELLNRRLALRSEVAEALRLKDENAIERAMFDGLRVAHQRQTENVYEDYRTAVFESGLSPEQRRLLFDNVMERLELPLPRAELQPTRRTDSW